MLCVAVHTLRSPAVLDKLAQMLAGWLDCCVMWLLLPAQSAV